MGAAGDEENFATGLVQAPADDPTDRAGSEDNEPQRAAST
jgi:hypothetical protein